MDPTLIDGLDPYTDTTVGGAEVPMPSVVMVVFVKRFVDRMRGQLILDTIIVLISIMEDTFTLLLVSVENTKLFVIFVLLTESDFPLRVEYVRKVVLNDEKEAVLPPSVEPIRVEAKTVEVIAVLPVKVEHPRLIPFRVLPVRVENSVFATPNVDTFTAKRVAVLPAIVETNKVDATTVDTVVISPTAVEVKTGGTIKVLPVMVEKIRVGVLMLEIHALEVVRMELTMVE